MKYFLSILVILVFLTPLFSQEKTSKVKPKLPNRMSVSHEGSFGLWATHPKTTMYGKTCLKFEYLYGNVISFTGGIGVMGAGGHVGQGAVVFPFDFNINAIGKRLALIFGAGFIAQKNIGNPYFLPKIGSRLRLFLRPKNWYIDFLNEVIAAKSYRYAYSSPNFGGLREDGMKGNLGIGIALGCYLK
jgi:hypothetical protein